MVWAEPSFAPPHPERAPKGRVEGSPPQHPARRLLDLLDERTFVVEQNEIVAVTRRVLKARLDPQHCEAGLG